MATERFYVVPAGPAQWDSYVKLCQELNGDVPMRHDKTLMIGCDELEGDIVAGCVLIATDGPYLLADGFVVNPILEPRDKYNVTLYCQHELKKIAAVMNRLVLVITSHQGIKNVLKNNGYQKSDAELFYYLPTSFFEAPRYADIAPNPGTEVVEDSGGTDMPRRGRGRPKGSRNRPKEVCQATS